LLICAKSALVGGQMEGSIWLTEHARARRGARIAVNIAKLPELVRKD